MEKSLLNHCWRETSHWELTTPPVEPRPSYPCAIAQDQPGGLPSPTVQGASRPHARVKQAEVCTDCSGVFPRVSSVFHVPFSVETSLPHVGGVASIYLGGFAHLITDSDCTDRAPPPPF